MVHASAILLLFGSSSGVELTSQTQQHLHVYDAESTFQSFKQRHSRGYEQGTTEYAARLAIFSNRLDEMRVQNSRKDRLWTAGINTFSDRTEAELSQMRGWSGTATPSSAARMPAVVPNRMRGALLEIAGNAAPLPRQCANWTRLSSLREAKQQRHCGSCWAVAAATVLEAHSEIHAAPRSFSIQELVNCVPNPYHCGGNGGCHGATVELALNYAIRHGLATEEDLPYKAKTGRCHKGRHRRHTSSFLFNQEDDFEDVGVPGVHLPRLSNNAGTAFGMQAWERLPENAYEPLLRAVYERGPVAVSVAATDWHPYDAGVFNNCRRNAVINHAVVLVGYGETSDLKFWTVQNSWGPDWGEDGRIRVLRHESSDASQHCGWDHHPEKGTACDGSPKKVKVCGMCGILYDSVVPHFSYVREKA